LAFDSSDNLFIADNGNSAVRKVSAGAGIITTVAGGAQVTNFDPKKVEFSDLPVHVEDGRRPTSGFLREPLGVAVDTTNLYITEFGAERIRLVSFSKGLIGPFAGTGSDGFLGDHGPPTAARVNTLDAISLDSMGNVYICDNNRVRIVTNSSSRLIDVTPFPSHLQRISKAAILSAARSLISMRKRNLLLQVLGKRLNEAAFHARHLCNHQSNPPQCVVAVFDRAHC
jgi:hypothetical protein